MNFFVQYNVSIFRPSRWDLYLVAARLLARQPPLPPAPPEEKDEIDEE